LVETKNYIIIKSISKNSTIKDENFMLAKRLDFITKILEEKGSVEVSELSRLCGVTEKTIRLDLKKLEELQIAKRVHGGALLRKEGNEIFPINKRKAGHTRQKHSIANTALKLINDGDTIFLDSGTTTLELAKILDKQVIVITNDPFIAYELLENEKVTLYVTGGRLNRERGSYTYVGPDALTTINNYSANKCFLGGSALNFERGIMVFSTDEVEVKRSMLQNSQISICLMDYSKFHKIAFTSYAQVHEINKIVTDDEITDEDIDFLVSKGIDVLIAENE